MSRLPTWPVAAGSLLLGFAVAQGTGVRPLGGIVLALGAAWCAVQWRARAGTFAALALVVLFLSAFAASHAITDTLGTWGAVLFVSAVVGAVTWAVADARRSPSARPPATSRRAAASRAGGTTPPPARR